MGVSMESRIYFEDRQRMKRREQFDVHGHIYSVAMG